MSTTHEQPASPASEPKPSQRDQKGRFGRGNSGGPGNPFGRQMAERRIWITEVITRDTLMAVMATLTKIALDGDIGAIKLILQYGVGKPTAAAEPDRVELEEWELHQASAVLQPERDRVNAGAPIRIANLSSAALTSQKEWMSLNILSGDLELKKVYREFDDAGEVIDEYEADEEDDADDDVPQSEFIAASHQTLDAVAKFTRANDGFDSIRLAKAELRAAEQAADGQHAASAPSVNGSNGKNPAEVPSPNGSNGQSHRSTNGKKHATHGPVDGKNGRQPVASRM